MDDRENMPHDGEGARQTDGGARPPSIVRREPALNLPAVIVALIALFIAVQLLRGMLSEDAEYRLLLDFAFLPLRYCMAPSLAASQLPDGLWPAFAGPVTHMFLHDGWMHLVVNSLWLAAFGAPVARRVGPWRFLALSMSAAAGGAALYLAFHCKEPALLLGASGAISGLMGAAIRLIYADNLPLQMSFHRDLSRVTPLSVAQCFFYSRPRAFILIWMGVNLAFGLAGMGAQMAAIAWEAHTGGFLTGLFAFGLFDRRISPTGAA